MKCGCPKSNKIYKIILFYPKNNRVSVELCKRTKQEQDIKVHGQGCVGVLLFIMRLFHLEVATREV